MAPGIASRPAQNIVDLELLSDVLEEKESILDHVLNHAYELPLKNRHPILRRIVDNLVIADLMRLYFQGVGINSVSADINNTAMSLDQEAYTLLGGIMAGRTVVLPNGQLLQNEPLNRPSAYILKGEVMKTSETLPIMGGIMGVKTRYSSYDHMGIDWDVETPPLTDNLVFNDNKTRAKGALRPL
jgi:hypothetical protein